MHVMTKSRNTHMRNEQEAVCPIEQSSSYCSFSNLAGTLIPAMCGRSFKMAKQCVSKYQILLLVVSK